MHDFARQVEQFVDSHAPDDLVILGTDENVARLSGRSLTACTSAPGRITSRPQGY